MVPPLPRRAAQTPPSTALRLERELAVVRFRRGVLILDHRDFKEQYRTSFGELTQLRIQTFEAQKLADSAFEGNRLAEYEQLKKLVNDLNERMALSIGECGKLLSLIEGMLDAIRKRDEEVQDLENQVCVAIQQEIMQID